MGETVCDMWLLRYLVVPSLGGYDVFLWELPVSETGRFERVIDESGLYAYKNWSLGEVAEGPKLSRYWISVKLMYPYIKMPDPKAGLRLTKLGCEVKYEKGILKKPMLPKSPEDLDEEGKPKLKSHDIWLIHILMPRKLVDDFKDEEVTIGDSSVNTEELNKAYDTGLDDETNQRQDI